MIWLNQTKLKLMKIFNTSNLLDGIMEIEIEKQIYYVSSLYATLPLPSCIHIILDHKLYRTEINNCR